MAAPVDAKRELDLIEKVEWRILSASSDEQKLQGLLKVYLAPLLVKAGSEHVAVRNKVDSLSSRSTPASKSHRTLNRSYRHARPSTSLSRLQGTFHPAPSPVKPLYLG